MTLFLQYNKNVKVLMVHSAVASYRFNLFVNTS